MQVVTMRVNFDGLYSWGTGWKDDSTYNKWNEFWNSKDGSGCFWTHFTKKSGLNDIQYLVSVGGSSYLHPMQFDVLYHKIGGCYKIGDNGERIEVLNEIDELKEICEKCVKFCGGKVTFTEPKISEI